MLVIKQYAVNATKVKQPLIQKNMSYKIYNHTIEANNKVRETISTFRKPKYANKNRKPNTTVHQKKRS